MSINNVILKSNYSSSLGNSSDLPFEVSSDGLETLKYFSKSPRQNLFIASSGNESHPININANDGYLYLTSKRLIYITGQQGDISTFSIDITLAPVLQLSHKIQAPWFGANYWEFIFFSAANPSIASDGFPKNQYFKGQIRFNDGGLFNFIEIFNTVLNDNVNNSHIDESLPRYSEI